MRKTLKVAFSFIIMLMLSASLIACGAKRGGGGSNDAAEKVELSKVMLGEVEFDNSSKVKLEQDDDKVEVTGTIDAMSASQKNAYGVDSVTHAVALKFTFDKEKTLSSFEIKGGQTKVYADDSSVENYSGSLSDLLDSESSEDAYANLVLSANTKNYTLTAKYTDESTSVITVEIKATLASADAE